MLPAENHKTKQKLGFVRDVKDFFGFQKNRHIIHHSCKLKNSFRPDIKIINHSVSNYGNISNGVCCAGTGGGGMRAYPINMVTEIGGVVNGLSIVNFTSRDDSDIDIVALTYFCVVW